MELASTFAPPHNRLSTKRKYRFYSLVPFPHELLLLVLPSIDTSLAGEYYDILESLSPIVVKLLNLLERFSFRSRQEQFGAGFTHYNQVLTLFILHRFAPSINSSLFIWETDNDSSDVGSTERPIDTIFKFHKAIRKDLEYLDIESGKLSMVMKQLFGNLVEDSGFCGVYIELIVILVGFVCISPSCDGLTMAKYYCNICKFFDDERYFLVL
ncbi:hypothetical protein ACSQ67_006401 [Phaseolus vulgaris]